MKSPIAKEYLQGHAETKLQDSYLLVSGDFQGLSGGFPLVKVLAHFVAAN